MDEHAIRVAAALARYRNGGLLLLQVVPLPRTLSFDAYDGCECADRDREELQRAVQVASGLRVPTRGVVRIGRDTAAIVLSAIEEHRGDAVVMASEDRSGLVAVLRRHPVERIAAKADRDVLVTQGGSGLPEVDSLLLAIAGWPYARFTADVAHALAAEHDSTVDVVRVVDTGASERAREQAWDDVSACLGHLDGLDGVTVRVPEREQVASTIVDRASEYDLTVLGAPCTRRIRQLLWGSIPRTVSEETRTTVLIARTTPMAI